MLLIRQTVCSSGGNELRVQEELSPRGTCISTNSKSRVRFTEKGGKSREIPCRHDLQRIIRDYLEAGSARLPGPMFRSAFRREGRLTENGISSADICRMLKRRLKAAGLSLRISPHSFRVTVATDLLNQNVPLEDVQYLLGHADARTTKLYDRRKRQITRNLVERISV